jgi:transcriptional regulator with XRE-family HTH domain
MATVEESGTNFDASMTSSAHAPNQQQRALHRIKQVRRRQGVSLRTATRRMGLDARTIEMQENETTDLRLSDLHRWQVALEVPVSELLVEADDPLVGAVRDRARLVRIMKTAAAILETARHPSVVRMAENLVRELNQLMPELKEIGPWHSVGQRRKQDELGRAADRTISDAFFDENPLD